jgi:hypothetical protein
MAVDEAMSREILTVLQPAAVEAAVLASEQQRQQQQEIMSVLEKELEAARYAAHRAENQFESADPDNRLVASELERRWNQALQKVRDAALRIEEQREQQQVEAVRPEEFDNLARDFEAVWDHPASDALLKRRIVRTLIEEIVVDIDDQHSEVIAFVHWKGGIHTELRVARLRRGRNRAQTPRDTVEAVRVLARICSDDVIAGVLTRNGLLTGRGNRWSREAVTALRSHHCIPCHNEGRRDMEGWLNLTQAASHLGVSSATLRSAIERGEIEGEHPLPDGPWILNRRALETAGAVQVAERALKNTRGAKKHPALPADGQGVFDLSIT